MENEPKWRTLKKWDHERLVETVRPYCYEFCKYLFTKKRFKMDILGPLDLGIRIPCENGFLRPVEEEIHKGKHLWKLDSLGRYWWGQVLDLVSEGGYAYISSSKDQEYSIKFPESILLEVSDAVGAKRRKKKKKSRGGHAKVRPGERIVACRECGAVNECRCFACDAYMGQT